MKTSCIIRPLLHLDLPEVLRIQDLCYTEISPESAKSLEAKRAASPSTCYAACHDNRLIGYLIALPWRFESPPELNIETCELPLNPDTLYLHDLAVSPDSRCLGAGRALVDRFVELIGELKLHRASLIAIQNSAPYWQRFCFHPVNPTPMLGAKLSSYGKNVQYMERVEPITNPQSP